MCLKMIFYLVKRSIFSRRVPMTGLTDVMEVQAIADNPHPGQVEKKSIANERQRRRVPVKGATDAMEVQARADDAVVEKKSIAKERHRRERIAESCAHLRELLPSFPGRRCDMVSVLEMTVEFITFAQHILPPQVLENFHVETSPQKNDLQSSRSSEVTSSSL
uniref:uncharacterized protein isoform X1 n=2 Tax=Myxine glutinosa TaxID=7769 RepID=UPI00358F6352